MRFSVQKVHRPIVFTGNTTYYAHTRLRPGASKGTPGDAKMRHGNPRMREKVMKLQGEGQNLPFLFQKKISTLNGKIIPDLC